MFVNKEAVGKRILQIRKKYGYSMQKFGEIIDNAPKGSVNSWEKGVNLPNEKRLKQIATLGNMTLNELLYGSFKEYVDMLITEKLGIELPEEFTRTFYSLLEQNGFTYGDDIEIVRLVNGFLTYHNLTTKETAIFYQPTAYSGDYFDGIIQKADSSVLVCRAYADKANNTLHIIPAFENGQTEEVADFFHALKSITAPHNNNRYFVTLYPLFSPPLLSPTPIPTPSSFTLHHHPITHYPFFHPLPYYLHLFLFPTSTLTVHFFQPLPSFNHPSPHFFHSPPLHSTTHFFYISPHVHLLHLLYITSDFYHLPTSQPLPLTQQTNVVI